MTELRGPAPIPHAAAAPAPPAAALPHAGPGIAAFAVSLVGLLGMLATFVAAALLVAGGRGGATDESTTIMLGMAMILMALIELVALGLGIGGLVQKRRRRVFAWLGVGIALLTLLATVGLIILGKSHS